MAGVARRRPDVIGAVEAVLAISFGALVFGGYLDYFLEDGIGLYLGAAAITLAFVAWRAGSRGVVGSVQDAARPCSPSSPRPPPSTYGSSHAGFLTMVAATFVVTVLRGVVFLVLGALRRGNLDPVRAVPGRRGVPRRASDGC